MQRLSTNKLSLMKIQTKRKQIPIQCDTSIKKHICVLFSVPFNDKKINVHTTHATTKKITSFIYQLTYNTHGNHQYRAQSLTLYLYCVSSSLLLKFYILSLSFIYNRAYTVYTRLYTHTSQSK